MILVMKYELILHLTLHQDLNCHPLKTMAVQAPSICNMSNSRYFLQQFLKILVEF